MKAKKPSALKKIKTGRLERRLSLATTGVVAGSKLATDLWSGLLVPKSRRQEHRQNAVAKQVRYFVDELGKLKGSMVKIGQVLALYGEHVLPAELVDELHRLEEQTIAVDWSVMQEVLELELSEQTLSELEIDHECLAAASLGQVHRATLIKSSELLCLKIQYPGVSDSIDSDLLDLVSLLKMLKLVSFQHDFDDLIEEVRQILHAEVDYSLEAEKTRKFASLLQDDDRFVVPKIYSEYSTKRLLAMSYESGVVVSAPQVQSLSLARRNELAQSFLELFFYEVYQWSCMQSDPNFGNYRVKVDESVEPSAQVGADKIVLLDFGAVVEYPESFILPLRRMLQAATLNDTEGFIAAAIDMGMISADLAEDAKQSFAAVCMLMAEPLREDLSNLAPELLNSQGAYRWAQSNLPARVAKLAGKAALSRHFTLPPKEFTFMSRKLIGVFNFIEALDAEFCGWNIIAPFIEGKPQ